jgi:hypothetical protein
MISTVATHVLPVIRIFSDSRVSSELSIRSEVRVGTLLPVDVMVEAIHVL